eukprot:CAMPEP_0201584948 /NCGR_PEP_ID=MMETSP0190_2-20130828/116715_1 /ASSEMBLY_ACC=CAM_ASM_000263 /TAXON_ID=37353 /ORGANISM="Rosalina sp." /LENGTH=115 /DNA_ID=CAMNT_0048029967 /DNA_START=93 /DNA_END=437 /DNA_ORIENTATION=-
MKWLIVLAILLAITESKRKSYFDDAEDELDLSALLNADAYDADYEELIDALLDDDNYNDDDEDEEYYTDDDMDDDYYTDDDMEMDYNDDEDEADEYMEIANALKLDDIFNYEQLN